MDRFCEKLLHILETAPNHRLALSDLKIHMLAETGLRHPQKLAERLKLLVALDLIQVSNAVVRRTEKALPVELAYPLDANEKYRKEPRGVK